MTLNFNCPVCGTRSDLVIGPTQAFCTNRYLCRVLTFDPSLPDGGLSNAKPINLDSLDDLQKQGPTFSGNDEDCDRN